MELYAELTNKLLKKLEEENFVFSLPEGVTLTRKQGSRCCFFECEETEEENLKDLLDRQGIPWQEM